MVAESNMHVLKTTSHTCYESGQEDKDHLVYVFKVLGNPFRYEIYLAVSAAELNIAEVQAIVGSSKLNVARALSLLHEASLLKRRKRGSSLYYSNGNPELLHAICTLHDKLST